MCKFVWLAPMLLLAAGCSKNAEQVAVPVPGNADRAAVIPAPAPPVPVTIPAGTPLNVRVEESIDTRRNRQGDGFTATLDEPLVIDGRTLIPAGTPFAGHVTTAQASGRFKGRARIGLTLDSFQANGHEYRVQTSSVDRVSANHKKRNAVLIGGGAGLGAAIGAIAGGGKGALIGAGAGAGAGTVGEALTGKRQVGIGAETRVRFTLRSAVEL